MKSIKILIIFFFIFSINIRSSMVEAESNIEIENNTIYIKEKIMDNFEIEINFREIQRALGTYTGKLKSFDKQKLINLFWSEKQGQVKTELYEGGAESLSCNGEMIGLNAGTIRYFKNDDIIDIKEIIEFGISENLLDKKELTSLSAENVLKKSEYFLEELQIGTEYRLKDFYAVDEYDLKELQELLKQNQDYQYFYNVGKLTELQFQEEDEVYYIRYDFYLDDMPVFSSESPMIEMTGGIDAPPLAEAMEAKFLISKEGIEYITMTGIVEDNLEESDKFEILNYEDIKKALLHIYEDVILPDKYRITDIYLEYIPAKNIVEPEEIEFLPSWCCEYHLGDPQREGYYLFRHAVRINALTGERIS